VKRGSESKSRYHSKVYPALTTRTIAYYCFGHHSSLLLFGAPLCLNLSQAGPKARDTRFVQIMTVV
jgi:hypothetical protein